MVLRIMRHRSFSHFPLVLRRYHTCFGWSGGADWKFRVDAGFYQDGSCLSVCGIFIGACPYVKNILNKLGNAQG